MSADTPAPHRRDATWSVDDPAALLEQLGDEYTRAALDAVLDGPRSGREVAEATDMSRPTAFRRLNALVDLGVVETEHCIDSADGHHHKQYRAVVESFSVRLGGDGVEVVVDAATGAEPTTPRPAPADD